MVCAAVAVIGASLVWDVAAQSTPAAPTGLQAVGGDTKVILLWADPGITVKGYDYKQKVGSGSYGGFTTFFDSSVGDRVPQPTHHTLTGLTNGTVYAYKIRLFDEHYASSGESAEATAIPAADSAAPTLGSVTASSTDGTVVSSVRYLNTGDTVTVSVPVNDQNPPSTAPTVVIKFGASGAERTLTAGNRTLSYNAGDPGVSPSSLAAAYPYTYTVQNSDAGTIRYKVTSVTDTAATPNSMTDQTTFTEISSVATETPVTNIGIQTASDSGADDNITNDTTAPVIEFTQTSGATVTAKYRKTGAAAWTTIPSNKISATGTAGTITLPNLTAGDGDYEMEITQQATGKQARTAHYPFVLDTTVPSVYIGVTPFHPGQSQIKISETGDVSVPLTAHDNFGQSTAISADGTLLAVGADSTSSDKGAVYLFEKSNNTWTQSLKIFDKATAAGAGELDISLIPDGDSFGQSVALSAGGTLLAVGSTDGSDRKGAVRLFEKSNNTWTQSLKISDNDGGSGELAVPLNDFDYFGVAVALSADGTLLAVSAVGDDDGGGNYSNRGAVYLFEKSGGTWSQIVKISDNGGGGSGKVAVSLVDDHTFGASVALSADGTLLTVSTTVVSTNKGAVYLFEKSGGTWSQTLDISDNNGGSGELDIPLDEHDYFGESTALSADGTLLAVGAHGDDDGDSGTGAVYLFKKTGGTWAKKLKISDNGGGTGQYDMTSIGRGDSFGGSVSFSADSTILAVGVTGDDDGDGYNSGAVYLLGDIGIAQSVSVSATDNERHGSAWQYVTTAGTSCGSAQFTSSPTTYTEGTGIAFTAESDAGRKVCFKTTDTAGNISYTLSDPVKTIDRTAPTLTATVIGTGSTRTYRVSATDTTTPITGRTKDNVATGSCTVGTDTSGTGWSDYTPGEIVGTAHDTNGRCVIITDGIGNSAKQHLSDGTSYGTDFSLDLDASGSFEPNRDAILLYLYTNQGSSASELTTFTAAGTQLAVTSAIGKINAVKDQTNTPMDMDGNGTFTANTDGAIPYLHSGQGYDATALVPFTYNRQQTTATSAITLVRGTITPNWP